jgi:nitrite reductase/ring-hydroxylating ferredoxin subunit
MAPKETVLGPFEEIPDQEGKEYEIEHDGETVEVFVVRQEEKFYGYVNYCPHAGTPLNWSGDRFMTFDKKYILCATHGAEFRIEDGHCIAGPCTGDWLAPLDLRLEDGNLVLTHPE